MIQLADMLVKPTEETMPKLILHIPTPIQEIAPSLPTPKIRLSMAGRTYPSFAYHIYELDQMFCLAVLFNRS